MRVLAFTSCIVHSRVTDQMTARIHAVWTSAGAATGLDYRAGPHPARIVCHHIVHQLPQLVGAAGERRYRQHHPRRQSCIYTTRPQTQSHYWQPAAETVEMKFVCVPLHCCTRPLTQSACIHALHAWHP